MFHCSHFGPKTWKHKPHVRFSHSLSRTACVPRFDSPLKIQEFFLKFWKYFQVIGNPDVRFRTQPGQIPRTEGSGVRTVLQLSVGTRKFSNIRRTGFPNSTSIKKKILCLCLRKTQWRVINGNGSQRLPCFQHQPRRRVVDDGNVQHYNKCAWNVESRIQPWHADVAHMCDGYILGVLESVF